MAVLLFRGFLLRILLQGGAASGWDHQDLKYATEDSRQWLNIRLADGSNGPTPVYLFAHENGGSADRFSSKSMDLITGAGYALVSWESIPSISTTAHVDIGSADAQLAYDWVRANAATYNFDPEIIVVGGRSRGSVLSWRLGHSGRQAIAGLYFYNALPNGAWAFPDILNPLVDVTADSPPLYFAYGPAPDDGDSHNPVNVYPVVYRYADFGMPGWVNLSHSMTAAKLDPFHFFPDFVASLRSNLSRTLTGNSTDTGIHTAVSKSAACFISTIAMALSCSAWQ